MLGRHIRSFGLHLLVFVLIEIIFVFLLFREIPQTNVFSAIGIGHLIYWIVLLLAGIWRVNTQQVWQRFLATYSPVLVHLAIHVGVGVVIFQEHASDIPQQELRRLIASVLILGILIYRGEVLLHRKYHCDTHHLSAHKHCQEDGHGDCEHAHTHKRI